MKKLNTAPLSGTQELLPDLQHRFNQLKSSAEQTFISHGFLNIETSIIDRTEILLAKAGGDTEKQIYKLIKTTEDQETASQALRFDHTVPLARYIAEHQNDLQFPFKVFQIGRNFRGERAQKGRFREFYQCDIDIVGRGSLPIIYDAEVISTIYQALKKFDLPEFKIRVSNRKILSGLIEELGLTKVSAEIFSIIDHAEKTPPEITKKSLSKTINSPKLAAKVFDFIAIKGNAKTIEKQLSALDIKNETFQTGADELISTLKTLEKRKIPAIGDLLIVRGLDYYTGTVFETNMIGYQEIGSICSGGRYDNLASHYTKEILPGVGGSIGLTRLFYILKEHKLLKKTTQLPIEFMIIPLSEQEYEYASKVAEKIRSTGHSVDILYTGKKISDKLNYAAKLANFGIVVGEEEVKTGKLQVKNFSTRKSSPLNIKI